MVLSRMTAAAVAVCCAGVFVCPAQAQEKKDAAKTLDQLVDAGVAYLKSSQAKDGAWSKGTSPGISGLVLTGLFRSGKVTPNEPFAVNGLKFVEAMVDPKEGHIAAGEGKIFHRNYITSVNLVALQSAKDKKYDTVIAAAAAYLKKLQWDETLGKKPDDLYYGGVGYGPGTRPDMSNTSFFLDALKAASVPSDDPAYKKALVFISRCQNWKSEHNDQAWAAKINDGSFIYVLGAGKGGKADDAKPGYGSMTVAGIKGFALGGLSKDDPRYKKAMEWFAKNYSVDINPGQAAAANMRGYYYYLLTMVKCFTVLGIDEFPTADGKKHDWRAEITAALAQRQKKNGSWSNENTGFQEGNADLSTAYSLITLSYCRPQKK